MADAQPGLPMENTPLEANRLQAVALRYRQSDGAPQIVAKGKGLIAEEILKRAKEAGIFVHASGDLISLLMQIDLDAQIPPQLYVVVAELLAWVYRQDEAASKRGATGGSTGGPKPKLR